MKRRELIGQGLGLAAAALVPLPLLAAARPRPEKEGITPWRWSQGEMPIGEVDRWLRLTKNTPDPTLLTVTYGRSTPLPTTPVWGDRWAGIFTGHMRLKDWEWRAHDLILKLDWYEQNGNPIGPQGLRIPEAVWGYGGNDIRFANGQTEADYVEHDWMKLHRYADWFLEEFQTGVSPTSSLWPVYHLSLYPVDPFPWFRVVEWQYPWEYDRRVPRGDGPARDWIRHEIAWAHRWRVLKIEGVRPSLYLAPDHPTMVPRRIPLIRPELYQVGDRFLLHNDSEIPGWPTNASPWRAFRGAGGREQISQFTAPLATILLEQGRFRRQSPDRFYHGGNA